MNCQQIRTLLERNLLFQRLSPAQLDRVARLAVTVSLDEGESLFEQQDAADRFYLLISGQVKLYRLSPNGGEKVIEVVNAGATFAEALMFMERPTYPVGAQAMAPTTLVSIDARDFVGMLKESVDTLLMLAADLSTRLHGLLRELNDLSLHSGTCRVATYFMEHEAAADGHFNLDLPKQVLASRLSIKPETLSRIMRSLCNAGLIEVEGSRVTIVDREHLADLAEQCGAGETSLGSTFYQTQ